MSPSTTSHGKSHSSGSTTMIIVALARADLTIAQAHGLEVRPFPRALTSACNGGYFS